MRVCGEAVFKNGQVLAPIFRTKELRDKAFGRFWVEFTSEYSPLKHHAPCTVYYEFHNSPNFRGKEAVHKTLLTSNYTSHMCNHSVQSKNTNHHQALHPSQQQPQSPTRERMNSSQQTTGIPPP